MAIITDGLLIATCLTAAMYCVVLSRRLARFSDTKTGIGQQISQLNEILEETRTTIKESHSGARAVSERLSRDLATARKASQDLSNLIERAETVLDRAIELQSRPSAAVQTGASNAILRPAQSVPPQYEPVPQQEAAEPEFQPQPQPDSVEDSPVIDEVADALAERDFELADARGEPQLGFLPSIADAPSVQDLVVDAAESKNKTETRPDHTDEASENLLQVERMAL